MSQRSDDLQFLASKYINQNVNSEEDALQGARDIIAEWINENMYVRKFQTSFPEKSSYQLKRKTKKR